tara:strand:+ start:309 stop:551 length:243 start_codon:yes stop_codon:yes gene_type:complete
MIKNLKTTVVALLVIAAFTMVSCKDNKTETKAEISTEKQGKEYSSAYVCPMHCTDSGSDKEGKCGTCGMTLVKNEGHKHQ